MAIIKFGTDGWRARIAEDFTYANVEIVTQALADYIKTQNSTTTPKVVVGYDRRFLSEYFAARTAEVLAGNGFLVDLFNLDVPTPLVSVVDVTFELNRVKNKGIVAKVAINSLKKHFLTEFTYYIISLKSK